MITEYTSELNRILEEIQEVDSLLKEERESDNDDNKLLRSLVDRKTRLMFERDILIANHKKW